MSPDNSAAKQRSDDAWQVIGPEMLFDRRQIVKGGRILLILRLEGHRFSRFLFPLLDQLRVAADLDCAPVIVKTHPPAESLIVECAQGRLKSVIIGGPEELAGQGAAGDGRKIAFDRLFFDDLRSRNILPSFH